MQIEKWLSTLPPAGEYIAEGIIVSGELLPSASGEARIVVGGLCLTLLRDDILNLEPAGELESSPLQSHPMRIVLRKGASLLNACPTELCGARAWGTRPFSLAVRPSVITHEPFPCFRALEHEFIQRHSLIDE